MNDEQKSSSRAAFEAHAKGTIGRIGRSSKPGCTEEYEDSHTQIGWLMWQASRAHTAEEAAQEAATWKGAKLLLNAGEMSMQEKRTATAVVLSIASAIRALKDNP